METITILLEDLKNLIEAAGNLRNEAYEYETSPAPEEYNLEKFQQYQNDVDKAISKFTV